MKYEELVLMMRNLDDENREIEDKNKELVSMRSGMEEKLKDFRIEKVKYILEHITSDLACGRVFSNEQLSEYLTHCLNTLYGNLDGTVSKYESSSDKEDVIEDKSGLDNIIEYLNNYRLSYECVYPDWIRIRHHNSIYLIVNRSSDSEEYRCSTKISGSDKKDVSYYDSAEDVIRDYIKKEIEDGIIDRYMKTHGVFFPISAYLIDRDIRYTIDPNEGELCFAYGNHGYTLSHYGNSIDVKCVDLISRHWYIKKDFNLSQMNDILNMLDYNLKFVDKSLNYIIEWLENADITFRCIILSVRGRKIAFTFRNYDCEIILNDSGPYECRIYGDKTVRYYQTQYEIVSGFLNGVLNNCPDNKKQTESGKETENSIKSDNDSEKIKLSVIRAWLDDRDIEYEVYSDGEKISKSDAVNGCPNMSIIVRSLCKRYEIKGISKNEILCGSIDNNSTIFGIQKVFKTQKSVINDFLIGLVMKHRTYKRIQ